VVAVLRSRGKYVKYGTIGEDENGCPITSYDTLVFDCDRVEITGYEGTTFNYNCHGLTADTQNADFSIGALNKGRFTIKAYKGSNEVGKYSVSLNPGAKDYIYNVIGSEPSEGSAAVFVEELYDVMLDDLITEAKVNKIVSGETVKYDFFIKNAVAEPVSDFLTIPYQELEKRNLGQRFIFAEKYSEGLEEAGAKCVMVDDSGNTVFNDSGVTMFEDIEEGDVLVVKQYVENSIKKYGYFKETTLEKASSADTNVINVVKVLSFDAFVTKYEESQPAPAGGNDDGPVLAAAPSPRNEVDFTSDFSDYREQFRYASTPWIVSELKGNRTHVEVKKLFRFHTITDGNFANRQVKISIANIRPDEGTFDVYVRDFNDVDASPVILESYKNVNMVPGSNKYIGLKIGTLNGDYELKSKYVMVEVIENEMTENCVPAGFLGYPVRNYGAINAPRFTYNLYYDNDVKEKRQYFGLSDITGVDSDMFTY
jgi:hypothetical protein